MIFVLLGLCLLFVVGYVQRLAAKEVVEVQIAQLKRDIKRAEGRQAVLLEEQKKVNDAAHVAKVARDDLGFVQEGDKPIVVIEPPATPKAPTLAPSAARTPVITDPNWRQWLDLVWPGGG